MAKANISVSLILDKSGSMTSVQDATISAINEYVESLKKDKKSSYKISLTLFDTEVEIPSQVQETIFSPVMVVI